MADKTVNTEPQVVDFLGILEATIKNLEDAKAQVDKDAITLPVRIATFKEVADYIKSNNLKVVQDAAPVAEEAEEEPVVEAPVEDTPAEN